MALTLKILLVLGALVVVGAAYFSMSTPVQTNPPTKVRVGDAVVAVEFADTPQERVQGLSGRESLADGTGLLFDFGAAGDWGIWMKDMRISIDIVWATEGRVVTVAHNVSPDTYPQAFHSVAPARYVLELPAGYAAAHDILEGGNFVIEQEKTPR